jgi:hypothetical protein
LYVREIGWGGMDCIELAQDLDQQSLSKWWLLKYLAPYSCVWSIHTIDISHGNSVIYINSFCNECMYREFLWTTLGVKRTIQRLSG